MRKPDITLDTQAAKGREHPHTAKNPGPLQLGMTMRYAHLAPEHLAEAVRLNPLASVRGYALES